MPRSSLWSHPDFMRLWSAQAVSALGSRFTRTAIPVIAVVAVGGSPLELGLLTALSVGPGAVVGLLAGGPVDRGAKRSILIVSDLIRALFVLSVPVAAWWGWLTMTQLYVVAAVIGCATALFAIADNAYLPGLIGKRQLLEGNTKLETTDSIAEVAGPALAGLAIEVLTAPVAMVIDAASYLASAGLLARIVAREQAVVPVTAAPRLVDDLSVGWRACWREPLVRPVLLATAVATLGGGFFFALYMLFTLETLGLTPATVGMVIGVGGVGALVGAAATPTLTRRLGTGGTMVLTLLVAQSAALLIPLATGPTWLKLAFLLGHQLIGDGCFVAFSIQAVSLRQSVLPTSILGRANGLFTVVTATLLPLGALAAGAAGEAFGVRRAIWIGVVVGLVAPLFLWPLRRLRDLPSEVTD